MTTTALPLTLSEAQFQRTVLDYALLRGWRCHHARPARTVNGWRTAGEGHPGLPDLVLSRSGVVILAELKTQHGRLSYEQKLWARELGAFGRVWRPSDWPVIVEELSAPLGVSHAV